MSRFRRDEEDGSNAGLWVVLGVVGGFLGCLALACAGIFYLVRTTFQTAHEMQRDAARGFGQMAEQVQRQQVEQQQRLQREAAERQKQAEDAATQQAADAFLQDVVAGRLNAAYESTSHMYQARCSRERFEAMVKQHRLRQPPGPAAATRLGPTRFISVQPTDDGRRVEMTVNVARQPFGLRVDQFSMDVVAAPAPR